MADNFHLVKGETGRVVKVKLVDLGDGTFAMCAMPPSSYVENGRLKVDVAGLTLEAEQVVVDSVKILGSMVEEVLTNVDADENNVLTFSDNIVGVEIYHSEDEPQVFKINGLELTVVPGGWRSLIGGAPGETVEIPADVVCVVSRLS